MQKVACPMMIVRMLKSIPTVVYVVCSASPVMIPGKAIGRMTTSEIVSRPKKRYRDTASETSVPSTRATAVAPRAASTESWSASRTPSLWYATENHFVEKFSIGQLCVTLSLNA